MFLRPEARSRNTLNSTQAYSWSVAVTQVASSSFRLSFHFLSEINAAPDENTVVIIYWYIQEYVPRFELELTVCWGFSGSAKLKWRCLLKKKHDCKWDTAPLSRGTDFYSTAFFRDVRIANMMASRNQFKNDMRSMLQGDPGCPNLIMIQYILYWWVMEKQT